MKKILLTGASGFIGSFFLRQALAQGFHVVALTRNSTPENSHARLEWCRVDIAVERNWARILKSIDVIVNLAAEMDDEDAMQAVNFDGPLRLLNAAIDAGVRRWVQLSSVGAYGLTSKGIVDEHWDDYPVGQYEKTKSDFDLALFEASGFSRINVCILRPSNVYGFGMRNQSLRQLLSVIRKRFFVFVGPVGASANYVHVQDVCQAIGLCVSHPNAANQTYIVSAWATIESLVNGLVIGSGSAYPSKRFPLVLAIWIAKVLQWWPNCPISLGRINALSARCSYSTGKIEKELGWKLTVPVEEGMQNFARDCR